MTDTQPVAELSDAEIREWANLAHDGATVVFATGRRARIEEWKRRAEAAEANCVALRAGLKSIRDSTDGLLNALRALDEASP